MAVSSQGVAAAVAGREVCVSWPVVAGCGKKGRRLGMEGLVASCGKAAAWVVLCPGGWKL